MKPSEQGKALAGKKKKFDKVTSKQKRRGREGRKEGRTQMEEGRKVRGTEREGHEKRKGESVDMYYGR